ncbi:MAG: cyclic nucleotide-binding domain-containing protein [Alphaproteobacteria bacterium]|nr:cyclic nucleotide-binding domain-containing protein [Alphaproteobacteria bacterium]
MPALVLSGSPPRSLISAPARVPRVAGLRLPAWLDIGLLRKAALARFVDLLARTRTLHVARTPEEREAIYRFRYQIYVGERNRVQYAGVDPARQRVCSPEDEHEGTEHYYFTEGGEITASLRYSTWEVGRLPDSVRREFAVDELEGLDQLKLCAASAFTVQPRLRGSVTSLLLALKATEHFHRQHRFDAILTSCAPGLVALYRRMGFRDFGATPRVKDVMLLPMVLLVGDLEYSRSIGGLWFPIMQRQARAGTLRRLAPDHPLLCRLARQERLVTSRDGLRAELARAPAIPLRDLSGAAQDWLLAGAVALDVPAGTRVTAEGVAERECYLVIDGAFEVRRGDRIIDRVGPGRIFGARGLFSDDGRRPESVHAVDGGRLLMIRHSRLRGRGRLSAVGQQARDALVATVLRPSSHSETTP